MGDAIGPIERELHDLAEGSLTGGYQTAIMEAMSRIDAIMRERGISRKALAERMGVDPSRITRLLNDPDNITVRTFYRLCSALGLRPSLSVDRGPWLVKGDDWVPTHSRPADGSSSGG